MHGLPNLKIDSNVFDFYFLIWSLSRLLCCVCSGFNVAAALERVATGTDQTTHHIEIYKL